MNNHHGVTNIVINDLSGESPLQRLLILMRFANRALHATQSRMLSDTTWTTPRHKSFYASVDKEYEKLFPVVSNLYYCPDQVAPDDYEAKVAILNDYKQHSPSPGYGYQQPSESAFSLSTMSTPPQPPTPTPPSAPAPAPAPQPWVTPPAAAQATVLAVQPQQPSNNNNQSRPKPMKKCDGNCGELHENGMIWRCNQYKYESIEKKMEMLKNLNICLKCCRKKFQGRDHNCRPPTCNTCKVQKPAEATSHHWSICPLRDKEFKQKALQQHASNVAESVNLAAEEEPLPSYDYDSGDDTQDFVGFTLSGPSSLSETSPPPGTAEYKCSFSDKIGDYPGSKYDVRTSIAEMQIGRAHV